MKISIGRHLVMIFSVLILLVACEDDPVDDPQASACNPEGVAGELLEANFDMTYTPDMVQPYLTFLGAPLGYVLEYSVDAYQITYHSRDVSGDLTLASGVIFIPQGLSTPDVMSVQHGTIMKRDDVGSVNTIYAFEGLLMAMNGYCVIAPDYLGLGSSQILHPYLHAELTANAVIDGIRALRVYACENDVDLGEDLFLTGYSEGGYATLATQKVMETNHAQEFVLTAVAPMAGPYDLLGSTREMLQREYYENPAFLTYLVVAYNDIYGWDRLTEIFNEPYASKFPALYDGTLNSEEINAQLTTNIDSLFKAEFRNSFLSGNETSVESALQQNGFDGWGPVAPVRLIHGTADETVNYQNSLTVYESMIANGGVSVDVAPVQGANHVTAAFLAYFIAADWFETF